ncbi:MAG: leucine-rich repeat protein, partial [Candidatus Thiodiazotropha sp.]
MLLVNLLSLTYLLLGVTQSASQCGPLNRCNCVAFLEGLAVDCQGANLSLQETCDLCSYFNKTVLSLDVSNNNLTGISDDCFSLCVNVRILSIRNTSLNPTEACDTCRQFNDTLISLDLSTNKISILKDSCFTGCSRLENLSLLDTNLHSLSAQALLNLKSLRQLNLDRNHLIRNCRFTNADDLIALPNLQVLTIKENVDDLFCHGNQPFLDNVPTAAFSSLKELHTDGVKHIRFGKNFTYFKRLSLLNLSGVNSNCSIISPSNETFSSLPFLQYLDVSLCNITEIDAGSFEVLRELTHLNLSNNLGLGFASLRNISYGLQATKIKVFDFSKVYKTFGVGTVLRRCDLWFFQNTSIEELYMNSNRLVMLEPNALLLAPPNLTKIWAEDNKFTFGAYIYQFGCVEKLQEVFLNNQHTVHDLSLYNDEIYIKDNQNRNEGICIIPNRNDSKDDCKIIGDDEKVHNGNFRLPENLSSVAFSNSNLKFKVDYNPGFPLKLPLRLEYADLSNNVLYYLGRQFIECKKLKHLDLSNNFCSFIEVDFFNAAPHLETVKLSHNILGSILSHDTEGQIFKPLIAATALDLSDNNIAFLPDKVFAHLPSIEILNLSSNHLTDFKSSSDHLHNLKQLDLQDNQLTTLPVTLLEQLTVDKNNITIDLSLNILEVSCENLEFLKWITENPRYFKNINSYSFRRSGESRTMNYDWLKETLPNIKKNCVSFTALITI